MQTRRQFLGGLGAFSVAPAAFLVRTEPELILFNANVITIDGRHPRAQAVATGGGRILAVGSNDKVQALATGRTKKIKLDGKTIVPGFIDAQTHPAVAGRMHLRQVDCDLRSNRCDQIRDPRARGENAGRRMGARFQIRRHEEQETAATGTARMRWERANILAPGLRRRLTAHGHLHRQSAGDWLMGSRIQLQQRNCSRMFTAFLAPIH